MRHALALLLTVLCPLAACACPLLQRPAESRVVEVGRSVAGRPITACFFGDGPDVVVYFAAFHGDEEAGVDLLAHLQSEVAAHPEWLEGRTVVIVAEVNPDGVRSGKRTNAHGVDINRNFPTRNWRRSPQAARTYGGDHPSSEPETRAVIGLLARLQPRRIVTIHAPLGEVNFDGPAADLAATMAARNGYPTSDDIGYPTPGSFGTYAGKERAIPTITLELPDADSETLWRDNREALLDVLFWTPPPPRPEAGR